MPLRPRTLTVGALRLHSVAGLAQQLRCTKNAAGRLLSCLRVPRAYFGVEAYFLESSLEEALLAMLDLGGPGLAAPGSDAKNRGMADGVRLTDHMDDTTLAPEKRVERRGILHRLHTAYGKRMAGGLSRMLKEDKRGG